MNTAAQNTLAQTASDAILAGNFQSALTNLLALQVLQAAQPDITATARDGVVWDRSATENAIKNIRGSLASRQGIQCMRFVPVCTQGGDFS